MFLDRGAEVSIVTANGDNCLTAAITAGHKDVCMTIVKHERLVPSHVVRSGDEIYLI